VSEKEQKKKFVPKKTECIKEELKKRRIQKQLYTGRNLHQNVIIFVSGLVAK
jgi:hypothetical protein